MRIQGLPEFSRDRQCLPLLLPKRVCQDDCNSTRTPEETEADIIRCSAIQAGFNRLIEMIEATKAAETTRENRERGE